MSYWALKCQDTHEGQEPAVSARINSVGPKTYSYCGFALTESDTRLTKGLAETNDEVASVRKEVASVREKFAVLSRRESKYVTYQDMCRYVALAEPSA